MLTHSQALKIYPWSTEKKNIHYTISELQRGIAHYFVDYFFGSEDNNTKILEEKKFGNFIVQKGF